MTEKFTTWGKQIKRDGKLLNINFETKIDAKLCCKLLNQIYKEKWDHIKKVDELTKWHKEHYGKSILDERLEFKSPCEKENEQLKKEIGRITKIKENWAFISDCSVQVMNEEEKFKEDYLRIATNDLKKLQEENEQLKQQLTSISQLIDNKIDEFKNGDYGDLPCNTIHMFLDLKQEMEDLE